MNKQQKQAFEVLSKRIVDEADVARLDAFLQGKDIKEYTSNPCMNEELLKEFITIGDLRKMLEPYSEDDLITVTKGNTSPNYRISHIEDSTVCGFFELRIE